MHKIKIQSVAKALSFLRNAARIESSEKNEKTTVAFYGPMRLQEQVARSCTLPHQI